MEQKPHYSSKWISIKEIITVSTSFYILQFLVEHFNWVLHFSLFINNKQNAPLVISYLVFLKLKTESSPCHCVFQVEQRQSNTGTRFSFFFHLSSCFKWYFECLRICQDEISQSTNSIQPVKTSCIRVVYIHEVKKQLLATCDIVFMVLLHFQRETLLILRQILIHSIICWN